MVRSDVVAGLERDGGLTERPSARKGSRKARTGCITCKLRRVKCDETKPTCTRCTKAGRLCHGYKAIKQDRVSKARPAKDRLLQLDMSDTLMEAGTSEERRCFQFFVDFTGPKLAFDLDTELWTALVLKLYHGEGAVRHAVLAISSLHQAQIQGDLDGSGTSLSKLHVFALRHYNDALHTLQEQTNEAVGHEPVILLLTCLLFVCIEYMQGRDTEALRYLRQGRELIRHFGQSPHSNRSQLDLITKHIVPIYLWSGITAYQFRTPLPPIPQVLDCYCELPPAFSSVQEARGTFYSIIDRASRYVAEAARLKYQVPTLIEQLRAHESERELLIRALSNWHTAFAVFRVVNPEKVVTPTAVLLQLSYHAGLIWISTALSVQETDFDAHIDSFSAIITLARSYLEATKKSWQGRRPVAPGIANDPSHGVNVDFFFDTHIISPLHFTAIKCRHPLLRKAALEILQKNIHRQEGLWRAKWSARIAARCIEIETETARLRINSQLELETSGAVSAYSGRSATLPELMGPRESIDAACGPAGPVPLTGSEHATPGTTLQAAGLPLRDALDYWDSQSHGSRAASSCLNSRSLYLEHITPEEAENTPAGAADAPSVSYSGNPFGADVDPNFTTEVDPGLIASDNHGTPSNRYEGVRYPRTSRGCKTDTMGTVVGSMDSFNTPPFNLPEGLRLSGAIIKPCRPNCQRVTFIRKSEDVPGKWDIWSEFIFLQ
ncbi:hypothetical protein BX600DRAFT_51040 [Xylariales sp. PMI_506]|nr:hypothetical protein BX600DRAFT_51040 [Xylariales sp. PMI_506]